MKFYLNENYLIKDQDNIASNLKDIKEMYEFSKEKNSKLYIKDNLDLDYEKLSKNRNAMIMISILKHLESINTNNLDGDILCEKNIIPSTDNYYFVELMSLCYRDLNELILSLKNEDEFLSDKYQINKNSEIFEVNNIIGKNELEQYCLYNPAPESVSEVFEKAENEFKHIKFTEKAFTTVQSRADILKQFGLSNLLDIFRALEEIVYPFFCRNSSLTQKQIQNEFKRKTKIEYSDESETTMQKYGYQREVLINGKKVKMRYHIKIKTDVRIYFKYIEEEDCIYIGHSGQHLDVAKRN